MINKKIVCCLGYIMTILMCTQAFAATGVTTTSDGIVITAGGDAGVPVTITMTRDADAELIGLLQGIFNDEGKCDFVFDYPARSGAYTFSINSHRYAALETAPYYQTDEAERETIYSEFVRSDDLRSFYEANEIKLSINMQESSDYYGLTDKAAVYGCISENKISVTEFYGIAEIFNKAVEIQKEKENQASLDRDAIDALNNAAVEGKRAVIESCNDRFGFDITYELGYRKLTNAAYAEQFRRVMESLVNLPYDITKVREMFDRNILIQSFNISGAKEAESLIAHYAGFFEELNTTNYKNLHDIDRTTALNAVLAKCPYTDITAIIANLKNEIGKINTTSKGNGTGRGGGSGGGGSYSGVGVVTGEISSTGATPSTESKPFDDIDHISWAKDSVEKLYALNIVSGTGDRTFSPDANVTREQFVKMLIGVIGEEAADGNGDFGDVLPNQWYSGYIAKAKQLGIAMGDEKNNFGVGENITREDLAVLIYRAAKLKGVNLPADKTVIFADSAQVSDYAKEAVLRLSAAGVINGFDDNTFRSKNTATRAQAAKLLYGVYVLLGGAV
ncbi:MAG: S-layer homology domain-containing protein [Clostridia bacterium]|nr:S-layer homology domain-containing protein [Clostridia bacterium]